MRTSFFTRGVADLGSRAANRDLTAYLDRRSKAVPSDWFSNVAGHLLGKVSEADLFAAPKSPDTKKERGQLCEAWFCSGMKKLLEGDKTVAADHFQKCLATEQKIFVESQFAQTEISNAIARFGFNRCRLTMRWSELRKLSESLVLGLVRRAGTESNAAE